MSFTRFVALSTRLTLVVLTVLAVPATPVLAAESCPNEQLRKESSINPATGQPYSSQLPDCRAYELSSPPNTGGVGVPIAGFGSAFLITADGSVFFESGATPAGSGAIERGGWTDVFRSRRTSSGWTTRDMTAFNRLPGNAHLVTASADGSAILITTPLSLSAEDLDNPSHNPTRGGDLYVLREGEPPQLVSHGEIPFLGVEPVGNISESPLIANGEGSVVNGDLSAVLFMSQVSLQVPFGATVSTGCYEWVGVESHLAYLTNPEGPESSSGHLEHPNCRPLAVAADGRAIIEDTSGDANTGGLYASGGGNTWLPGGAQQTIRLSGARPGVARFDALSPNGETVYLTTPDALVASSDSGSDIYAINLRAPSGLSVSPPQPPAVTCVSCEASGAANVGGATWVGQSADGSHVFFTVAGALYEHDSAGTRLVSRATDGVSHLVFSRNGQHMIALTSVALSQSDTNGVPDVYEFTGGSSPELITGGVSTTDTYNPVGVSDDGRRVLYEDEDRPSGTPNVIDESVAGQTSQISPLGAIEPYSVMGTAGAQLDDVFFEAHEPLAAQDLNAGTTDVYDARIGGGFPAPTPPVNDNQTSNPTGPATPAYTGDLTPLSIQLPLLPADTSHPPAAAKSKVLTPAQKLEKALKACPKRPKKRRAGCESRARRKYGMKFNAKHARKGNGKAGR